MRGTNLKQFKTINKGSYMPKIKYLLVGGPHDGESIELEFLTNTVEFLEVDEKTGKQVIYRHVNLITGFAPGDFRAGIYVYSELNRRDALSAILNNYKPTLKN